MGLGRAPGQAPLPDCDDEYCSCLTAAIYREGYRDGHGAGSAKATRPGAPRLRGGLRGRPGRRG